MTHKTITSMFLVSALALYVGTPQVARSDASKAGTYPSAPEQPAAPAQPTQQPGVSGAEGAPPVTTAERGEVMGGALQKEGVGFQPQVGAVNYRDTSGNVGNRALYGMTFDMNVPSLTSGSSDWFLGPQLGFFFSHIGASNGNFLGHTPAEGAIGDAGTNMFFIPTDLKLGYSMGNFRPSIHGGANLFYRSVASAFALSSNPDTSSSSAWKYLPNLGIDLELALSKGVALIARPDITFGGSFPVWAAAIGASFPLG